MFAEKTLSQTVPTSKIYGRVCSSNGAVIKDARVTCRGMETRTLANGSFVFQGLAYGTYTVQVTLQGYETASKTVSVLDEEGRNTDFHLSSAAGSGKIHGYFYDAETNENMKQEGTAILSLPIANKYKHIDKDGYYEFTDLPSGTYRIIASVKGYLDCNSNVEIANGERKEHDFFLKAMRVEEPPWG